MFRHLRHDICPDRPLFHRQCQVMLLRIRRETIQHARRRFRPETDRLFSSLIGIRTGKILRINDKRAQTRFVGNRESENRSSQRYEEGFRKFAGAYPAIIGAPVRHETPRADQGFFRMERPEIAVDASIPELKIQTRFRAIVFQRACSDQPASAHRAGLIWCSQRSDGQCRKQKKECSSIHTTHHLPIPACQGAAVISDRFRFDNRLSALS